MNKKGFTLIEVIVSVVLVSVVMVSLLSSLIQLRKTYTVIHEDSDIIVYSSSISRIINNDLIDNNGIRYVSCNIERTKCDMILGNDSKRILEIGKEELDDLTYEDGTKKVVRTTIRYIDSTKENKELLYIRTLDLDRYERDGKVTTSGYSFLDINPEQKEHNVPGGALIDTYTTVTIRIYNGVDEQVSKYNIKLYTAGRYDYSHLVGKVFTIGLNSNGADVVGSRQIDEVFGVGFFETESSHNVNNQLRQIEIPKKGSLAFLGYFYKKNGVETVVVDSTGKITVTNRFFKENVEIPYDSSNPEEETQVYAKWGDCNAGYEIKNGGCYPKNCTVRYDLNGGSMLSSEYTGNNLKTVGGVPAYNVLFNQLVPDLNDYNKTPVEVPVRGGYEFGGFKYNNILYHDVNGLGQLRNVYYNDGGGCPMSITAQWTPCAAGQFSLEKDITCSICGVNSYTSAQGTTKCKACGEESTTAGYYNTGTGNTGCTNPCTNNYQANTWKQAKWHDGTDGYTKNTVSDICVISSCKTGYQVQNPNTNNTFCKIAEPAVPTISGASEKIFGSSDTTLTCTTSTTFVSGTNVYYSFGYATSDGGTPGSTTWTTPSTTNTYKVVKDSYASGEFDRYYSCRVYAKDDSGQSGAQTSPTITSNPTSDVLVRYNNVKITFNPNNETLSGSGELYTRKGIKTLYTGIRNTSTMAAPQATKKGHSFKGWYDQPSGGTQIIKPDKTVNNNFTYTADVTLYAQFAECAKGKYNEGNSITCSNCPANQYQDEAGKTSCKSCPTYYPSSAAGSDAQTDCYRTDACTTNTCSYTGCSCGYSASGTYSKGHDCTKTDCNHTACDIDGQWINNSWNATQTCSYSYRVTCDEPSLAPKSGKLSATSVDDCVVQAMGKMSGCTKGLNVEYCYSTGGCSYSCSNGTLSGSSCVSYSECLKYNANHDGCSCSGTYYTSEDCTTSTCSKSGCSCWASSANGEYVTHSPN